MANTNTVYPADPKAKYIGSNQAASVARIARFLGVDYKAIYALINAGEIDQYYAPGAKRKKVTAVTPGGVVRALKEYDGYENLTVPKKGAKARKAKAGKKATSAKKSAKKKGSRKKKAASTAKKSGRKKRKAKDCVQATKKKDGRLRLLVDEAAPVYPVARKMGVPAQDVYDAINAGKIQAYWVAGRRRKCTTGVKPKDVKRALKTG